MMTVWGTFVSFLCLALAVVVLLIGSSLMSFGRVSWLSGMTQCFHAVAGMLGLILAVMLAQRVGYQWNSDYAIFIVNSIMFLLGFVFLSLPSRVYHDLRHLHARRVLWIVLGLFALVCTVIDLMVLADAVTLLTSCLVKQSLILACSENRNI
jgi:hypothetical protein